MPSYDNIEHGELFNKLMSEQAKGTYIGLPSKGFFVYIVIVQHILLLNIHSCPQIKLNSISTIFRRGGGITNQKGTYYCIYVMLFITRSNLSYMYIVSKIYSAI